MKLHNSLTKQTEEFVPKDSHLSIYSCGPTVYNNLHIGNLSAFVYADLLRRVLASVFPNVEITHVMNVTDVDDKTIRDSKLAHNDKDPMAALIEFTRHYEQVFMDDIRKVGNDLSAFTFIRATDSIKEMQMLITELFDKKIAYLTEDGVYFSIEAYQKAGKKYGQLVELEKSSDTKSRIANDEYDKDSANDFALWKVAKEGEPSWEYRLGGKDLTGRPGWHIECSAMSRKLLGKEFDIHTGGIDLKFPHHENEIAQSTACEQSDIMARIFMHNDHVLVDGVKMSKSLGNFFTLRDIETRGFNPLAFRLLVLQGHYRNSVNFSWENLQSASNRMENWLRIAALRHQPVSNLSTGDESSLVESYGKELVEILANDLDTPRALAHIDASFESIVNYISPLEIKAITKYLQAIDNALGLNLLESTPDISDAQKELLTQRAKAREAKNWQESDNIRDELKRQGVEVRDDKYGQLWSYVYGVIDSPHFCL